MAKLSPADVLLGKGTKVSELCKQPEVAIGFSAKKIPGTVYTKMGAASGARVPRGYLVQTIPPVSTR